MLQSLAALPLSALGVALLFLLILRLTPLDARRAAVVTAMASLGLLGLGVTVSRPGADVIAMYVAVLAVTAYLLAIVGASRERRLAEHGDAAAGFHWGPALIVGFFALLFATDGLLVMISREGPPAPIARWLLPDRSGEPGVRSVFPGVVARDYQTKEGDYNQYLQRIETQEARGWRIRKGWVDTATVGRPTLFQVAVEDRQGRPLTGAAVTGVFRRPSDSRLDRTFSMRETGPGTYRAAITLPEPGRWDLSLSIRRGDDVHEVDARTAVAPAAAGG